MDRAPDMPVKGLLLLFVIAWFVVAPGAPAKGLLPFVVGWLVVVALDGAVTYSNC